MEGLWPLVVMWILFSVLGSRKKRPPANRESGTGNRESKQPGQAQLSLPEKFRNAMEELQRAEREAMQGAQGAQGVQNAQKYLEELKKKAQQKRQSAYQPKSYQPKSYQPKPVPRVPQRPELIDDDSDQSSEDVFTPEGVADYDDEAEKIAKARHAAADRTTVRRSGSIEGLTEAQQSRRGGRPDQAIGGRAEHDAWHVQMQATEADGQAARRPDGRKNPLAKYADGSMRGALILSEILGQPKGQQ